MNLFREGTLWQHKSLLLEARIIKVVVQDEQESYLLAWCSLEHATGDFLLRDLWTASELIQDFEPAIPIGQVDILLEGDLLS